MLETAESGETLSKAEYEAIVPELRLDLINAQFDLQKAGFPVIILVFGNDRWGCNEVIDRMQEWMDARYIRVRYFGNPTDEERMRPRFWRYWRALPRDGVIGVTLGAWSVNAVADRVNGDIDDAGLAQRLSNIRGFEHALTDDGALLLKFYLHLPKDELARRLKKSRKDPDKVWYVDDRDWEVFEHYDEIRAVVEHVLRETASDATPWLVVESTDDRHRDVTIARTIRDAMTAQLESPVSPPSTAAPVVASEVEDALGAVDLTATIKKPIYRERLAKLQAKLNRLTRKARDRGQATMLAFEGWDAAGKGGVIRRITGSMSARDYDVVPIAAPTDEERAHHYLWRFWRHVPRDGRMVIFDRTWYGRVLVERVEGYAEPGEWRRAYGEINDFEQQLAAHGIIVLKFWLHIDPDEQLRRFQAREQTAYKKYKITDDDYRNRDRWNDYAAAVNEMVARTSTDVARWHLIPANDKRFARIQVLEQVCRAMKKGLDAR